MQIFVEGPGSDMSSMFHNQANACMQWWYLCKMYQYFSFAVALYQFVLTTHTVPENVSSFQFSVELASSSGMLINDITLFVSTVGGSATGELN